MLEKILLTIAIAFALYWTTEVKPPQRVVAIETEVLVETLQAERTPVFVMV